MKLLLDENFNGKVLRALVQHNPELDIVRAQDIPEIAGKGDPRLLAWAAEQERVLFTHDVRTVTKFAHERIKAGLPMPGVVEVKRLAPIRKIVEDIMILVEASNPDDIENRVVYIPFT